MQPALLRAVHSVNPLAFQRSLKEYPETKQAVVSLPRCSDAPIMNMTEENKEIPDEFALPDGVWSIYTISGPQARYFSLHKSLQRD